MYNTLKLIISVVGCQLVGILGAFFTAESIKNWYSMLNKPFFSPPNWLFGPVWTLLYLMMGVSFYLIWIKGWQKKKIKTASYWFFAQLAFNFAWSPVFFGLKSPLLGLINITIMWLLIIKTIKSFWPLSKKAAILLVPYLLWVSFATLLNGAIWWLN